MADGLELRRYLLSRELEFWREEGQERTGDRIFDLRAGSPEVELETAWQERCLDRCNSVARTQAEPDRFGPLRY